jgi:S1-C subfamily serine protease
MGGPRVLQGRKAPAQPALPAGGGPADVGFVLAQGPGRGLVVQAVLPGGPAASSGQIRPGDLLIDVDGHDVVAPRPVRPTNPPFCILPFVSPILS